MTPFFLSEDEKNRLRSIHALPPEKQQAAYSAFHEDLYKRYKIDRKRYFSVQTFPESRFGYVTLDTSRVRTEAVKKISKSDQPNPA